ncbi:MAG: sugar phosphate isomerase/epimerase family protein [Clostridia bacterium]|jgi:sugar phosphate isomerase/epimerase
MTDFMLSAFADEIDSSLSTQMDVLKKYGINYIEMRGVNGKNITEYSIEQVREIRNELDKNNFAISAIASPIGKISINESFEQHFELFIHTLDIAEILKAKYIRLFSFYIDDNADYDLFRNEIVERIKSMVKAAEARKITLLHENEKGIYGDTPERCLDLLETIGSSYFRATFDPANFIQCGIEAYPYAYRILKNHIDYFHVKDAVRGEKSNVPTGLGDGKIKEILQELSRDKSKIFVSLEPHLSVFEGFHELEQNIDRNQSISNDGIEKFDIAYNALDKIINGIKEEVYING